MSSRLWCHSWCHEDGAGVVSWRSNMAAAGGSVIHADVGRSVNLANSGLVGAKRGLRPERRVSFAMAAYEQSQLYQTSEKSSAARSFS